jgi:hypothetical protein
MTVLGKLLVLVNVFISVFLATWAFGVWTNRIDWSNAKGGPDKVAGEFARRDALLTTLYAAVPPAEAAWQAERSELFDQEHRRAEDRAWYQAQLDHLRGKATAADPARTLVYADQDDEQRGLKKGQLALDPKTGRPLLVAAKDRAGNPLVSLAAYDAAEQSVLATIEGVQAKYEEQIKQATALTESLIGPKGLQQRLADEKKKRADVVAEEKLVRPLLINSVVESDLVLKRHRALLQRIDELKRVGVAAEGR